MEDYSVKRPPEAVLFMVRMMIGVFRKALQQVPNDVDEETAKDILFQFVFSQIPEEQVSRCHFFFLRTIEMFSVKLVLVSLENSTAQNEIVLILLLQMEFYVTKESQSIKISLNSLISNYEEIIYFSSVY